MKELIYLLLIFRRVQLLIILIALIINGLSLPVQAGRYYRCFQTEESRTRRDPANHPTAYENGYQEGLEAAENGQEYEPRTAGGEFARGFEDGYHGRPSTGQKYTVPDRQETRNIRQCKTYLYNEDDSIENILNKVLGEFERDLLGH